jgi:aryl-phospho-beta-D-glucosidase BglC (GH1 family)
MKTYRLNMLFVIALVLAGCQSATSIPATATPTPEPPTYTPTYTPTITLTPTITPTPTVGPGGFPRRFHVEGNAFVDEFGQKMIFRGMASPDPTLMSACTAPNICGDPFMPAFNEAYFQAFASWGPNILRIPIVPFSLHTYGLEAVLKALDQTIAWAGENNMYVIITFQSVGWFPDNWYPNEGGDTSVEEWTGFWQTISSRYAGNAVVAFYELFSEPALSWSIHQYYPYPSSDWLIWKGLVENLINNTIRPNDPDKIVLVGGLLSAYDLSYVAAAPIVDISNNVAYSTHPYPSGFENQHLSWDTAFGNLSAQYPVFATEYGYDIPSTDPLIGGIPYHQVLIDYLEAHHISWTAWIFAATWAPVLLKDYQNFETTESGTFFRSRLLELNGTPLP